MKNEIKLVQKLEKANDKNNKCNPRINRIKY